MKVERCVRRGGMSLSLFFTIALLFQSFVASAATLYVWEQNATPAPPYDAWETASATIRSALLTGNDGDTIVVRSGLYVENIDFVGKAIALVSESGPETTIIDGNEGGSVVTFARDEGPASSL